MSNKGLSEEFLILIQNSSIFDSYKLDLPFVHFLETKTKLSGRGRHL